jgi:hypothetical protein
MPWYEQPKKDATSGDTPRGVANNLDPWESEWGNPIRVMSDDLYMN